MASIPSLVLGYVAGIAAAPWVPGPLGTWVLAALCLGPVGKRLGPLLALCLGIATCRLVPEGPALEGDVVVLGVRVGAASGRDGHVQVTRVRSVGGAWEPSEGRIQVHWPDAPPPAGADVLLFGRASSARVQRLPGSPDPTRAMERVGIRSQVRVRRMKVVGGSSEPPRPPRDPSGLLTALAVGDRSGLSPRTVEVLRATGTSHLLAISGFHVGVVAMLALAIARRVRTAVGVVGPRGLPSLELLAAVGAAFAYATVAGAPLSAQRAAGLLALGAVGRGVGRGVQLESLLGLVAVAVLWVDPAAVATSSFQLSFGVVLGLLRVGAPLQERLPQARWRWLSSGLSATIGATVGTLPAAAWWFQDLAILSPLANLVALPLTSTVLVPAAGLATFGPEPLASLADTVGSWAAWLLVLLLEPMAMEPLHPAVGPVGALVLGLAVLLAHRPALATLLTMLALGLRPLPRRHTVTFLAVGQGDATLVEHADGTRWLIDGGPGRTDVTAWLRRRGIRRIDRVVATHNQRDHIAGLELVVSSLRVGELHVSGHAGLGVVRTAAEQAGVPILSASGLHPSPGFVGSPNDRSVVLATGPVLLTGDIEGPGEAAVSRAIGTYAVLKVPHHGSTTSSSPRLLDTVRPDVAVVSVGIDNPWDHPRDVVLSRYGRRGIAVLRTDEHGTLEWSERGWRAHKTGRGWYEPLILPPPPTTFAPEDKPTTNDPMRVAEVTCIGALPSRRRSWSPSWSSSEPAWSTCGPWLAHTVL